MKRQGSVPCHQRFMIYQVVWIFWLAVPATYSGLATNLQNIGPIRRAIKFESGRYPIRTATSKPSPTKSTKTIAEGGMYLQQGMAFR